MADSDRTTRHEDDRTASRRHDEIVGPRAVEAGIITTEQLAAAQREQAAGGGRLMLGQILLKQGLLTARQLARLIKAPSSSKRTPRTFGKYTLGRALGQGGMGEVFAATDRTLDRPVALKLLTLPDARSRERFAREGKLAARLEHPAIVPIYEVGEADGRPFIAMQLIDGQDLRARKLPLRAALQALRTIALAVDYAHGLGVVHRDIKPGNILMTGERVLLTDFGLARDLTDDDSKQLSLSGAVLGTPAFMAPEQALGKRRQIGPATDVYALGATLYYLVTRKDPYRATTRMELMSQVAAGVPEPPRKLNPRLPAAVQTIVLKAMEARPADRYESAGALAADLGRFLDGEPIQAVPPSLVLQLRRRLRKHRTLALSAGVIAVVIAIAIGVTLRQRSQNRAERDAERARVAAERDAAQARAATERARLARAAEQAQAQAQQVAARIATQLSRAKEELAGFDLQVYAPAGSQQISTAYLDRAEAIADALARLAPASGAADYVRGAARRRRGQLEAARQALETAIERAPTRAPYDLELAEVHADQQRRLRAKARAQPRGSPERADLEAQSVAARERLSKRLAQVHALGGVTGFAADALALRTLFYQDQRLALARLDALAEAASDYRRRSQVLTLRAQLIESVTIELAPIATAFRAALALRPSDYQLMADLADALLLEVLDDSARSNAHLAEAARLSARVVEIHPGYARGHLLAGQVADEQARGWDLEKPVDVPALRRAARHISEALRLDPALAEAYLDRASVYRGLAVHDDAADAEPLMRRALADLDQAIRLLPSSGRARDRRARLRIRWARNQPPARAARLIEQALADSKAAGELDPRYRTRGRDAEAWSVLAQAQHAAGRDPLPSLTRAIAATRRQLAAPALRATQRATTRRKLADLHRRAGDWKALVGQPAATEFQAALDLWLAVRKTHRSPPYCDGQIGTLQVRLGEASGSRAAFEAAVASFDRALAGGRSSPRSLAGRARARRQLGQLDAALADIEAAVAASGRNLAYRLERARIRVARGEHDPAREELERILERRDRDLDAPPPYVVHRELARMYDKAGDRAAATRHRAKARALCPALKE